jgi:hypothetical protein
MSQPDVRNYDLTTVLLLLAAMALLAGCLVSGALTLMIVLAGVIF